MTQFQLDTSGAVDALPLKGSDLDPGAWLWSDLSPFTQGYIEALFAAAREENGVFAHAGFSDVAPETLACIIADCAAFIAQHPGWDHPDGGRLFWEGRNGAEAEVDSLFGRTCQAHFPPLTVQLGDDGKVVFA